MEPLGQDLDVPGHHLPQLGLDLGGQPLLHHGDLQGVELGRGAQAGGAGLGAGRHGFTCWVVSVTGGHLYTLMLLGHCLARGHGSPQARQVLTSLRARRC